MIFSPSVHGRPVLPVIFLEGDSGETFGLVLAESREDEGMRYGFISGGVDGEDAILGMLEEC